MQDIWTRQNNIRRVMRYLITPLCIAMAFIFLAQPTYAVTHKKKSHVIHHAQAKTKKKRVHIAKTKAIKPLKKPSKLALKKTKRPKISLRPKIQEANLSYNSHLPVYLMNPNEQRLISKIKQTVSTLRYSSYKLGGTYINPNRGIYVIDCSTYVDHILKNVYPQAFSSLAAWTHTEKPTSDDFYDYFVNLYDHPKRHWHAVDTVEDLRPGDVLVFRYKNSRGRETGGHVMIVMDKPIRHIDGYSVRIADSAPSGHSKDTRSRYTSGIGIGTLLLKDNAYAWKVGANWNRNVYIAMARPVSIA